MTRSLLLASFVSLLALVGATSCSGKKEPDPRVASDARAEAPKIRPLGHSFLIVKPTKPSEPPQKSIEPASSEPSTKPKEGSLPDESAVGRIRYVVGPEPVWSERGAARDTEAPPTLGTKFRLLGTIPIGFGYLEHAQLSRDGREVLVLSGEEGLIRHYDVATKKLLGKHALPKFERFDSASFTWLDGIDARRRVLLVDPSGSHFLDLASGEFEPSTLPNGDDVRLENRAGLVAVAQRTTEPQSGSVSWYWFPEGEPKDWAGHLRSIERPDNWALSADGARLALLSYPSDEIEVYDLVRRELLWKQPAPEFARGLALSPDGSRLAVGGSELRLLDARTGALLDSDSSYGNNIHEIRFTPDARLLLVSAYDGKARSYTLDDGGLGAKQLLAHAGTANVYAIGFDRHARRIVTSSGDKTIKIWER